MTIHSKLIAGIAKIEKATGKTLYKPYVATRAGTLDPVTDTTTGDTQITFKAVSESYRADQIDGDLIKSTDYQLIALVEDMSEPLAIGDLVDGYRVQNLNYAPADPDEAIAVTIQMRKV